jgi:hypothetical protein
MIWNTEYRSVSHLTPASAQEKIENAISAKAIPRATWSPAERWAAEVEMAELPRAAQRRAYNQVPGGR